MRLMLMLAVAAALAACFDEIERPPTPIPTPTPAAPFSIGGPIDQQTAFEEGAWFYVIAPATGELHAIRNDPAGGTAQPTGVGWLDDSALSVTARGIHYRLTLDGDVSTTDVPAPRVSPFDAIHSADGLWIVTRTGDGLRMTENSTGRTLDVPYTGAYDWAPAGHRLVAGGGWCGNGRIAVVDPDGAGVIPVTDGRDVRGIVWYWRPDGGALALETFDSVEPYFRLILVDATTGAISRLAPVPPAVAPGEFVPMQWNPSGTRLLFRIHGGRDCSD